jgi:hypothetical protein
MQYDGEAFVVITVALFATGMWVESNDDEPQIARASVWGYGFVVTGWFILTLIDIFGVFP